MNHFLHICIYVYTYTFVYIYMYVCKYKCVCISPYLCNNHPDQDRKNSLVPFSTKWHLHVTLSCFHFILTIQFSSVAQLCPTPCDPMDCNMPGLPVYHQLPELTQTHVHHIHDAIQPSHPLSSSSPPAPNPSQHQGLFQWVSSSHQVAKVLEFQPQHQSFQWTPRTDLL